ncbi:exopolysaccharide biosynthesis polyprenyl glycosylphosphotransferase [Pseudobutyrivibrio sp. 49]|uniref:sugar transferase n=1 Tax=unclassified Pseudobutyrivibrio TaxID=2638619 RepID=UPI00088F59BC|nr:MULTISPECIES: sugar transferase [unclassified Pseudobutyrivibrio]SDH63628.1 exopolysaccharide biosynthesis polyprenyl glycosylphosphotransferase [Pseudobutyrivibrio sp. 49]SFN77182.1 exopolysaccharide biosynthesis polyprenyl glycosylphosphotransferase [Pseudobutyrivibrio sp. UC1225]
MNKENNIETQKKFFRFASSVVLVAVLATLFGVMWYMRLQYLMNPYTRFLGKGNYLMIALYGVITILMINTFKGFGIGTGRISILTMSQAIAMGLVNVLEFFIIILMTRIKSLMWITLGYIIVLTVADAVAVLFVTYFSTKLYRMIFPPFSILNIFGGYENDLVWKMNQRADKYSITGEISCREPIEKITKELENYDAVLINDVPAETRNDIIKACFATGKRVYFTPKISDILIKGSDEVNLFDTPLYLCKNVGMDGISAAIKRAGDILISGIGIILTSPIMLVTAILIHNYDGGPALYKQTRCTIGGKEYKIMKFRSMVMDAEKDGKARLASVNDDRITPIGHFIRATRIDELPQFFNIFKGDMSVVGPRPERPEIIAEYVKEVPEFAFRTHVKAGLTGYAQVYGKYNTTSYDKLKLDMIYCEKCSVLLDIQLILMTLRVIFTKEATEGVAEGETNANVHK